MFVAAQHFFERVDFKRPLLSALWRDGSTTLSARGQGVEADSMASRTPAHGADGRREFGRDMEIHV